MTQPEWSERLARSVARELRRFREARGMSAQQLADACASIGMPIQRSVIANFENGRRTSIGVAEVLVFAAALKIPPVLLISPAGSEPSFELLPGRHEEAYAAAMWIGGTYPALSEDASLYRRNPIPDSYDAGKMMQRIDKLKEEIEELESLAGQLTARRDAVHVEQEEAEKRYVHAKHVAAETNADDDDPAALRAGIEALGQAKRAAEESLNLTRRLHDLADRLRDTEISLEAKRGLVRSFERNARAYLKRISDGGWLLPGLPPRFEYLLDERTEDLSD
jgi:transcriptional regulator with XRE-family HTH domain